MVRGPHREQSPEWKRYKNRKQHLKRDLRAGKIDEDEHAHLMELAWERYQGEL